MVAKDDCYLYYAMSQFTVPEQFNWKQILGAAQDPILIIFIINSKAIRTGVTAYLLEW